MAKIPFASGGKAERAGIGMGPMFDLVARNDFLFNWHMLTLNGDAVSGPIDPATNGTAAAVAAGTNGRGITLTTGTDDDGYAGIAEGLIYNGDRGCAMEALIELPATITTMKIECGFTDALADAGAVLVKATPTATATDYGVFVFDTDDDTALAFHSAKGGTVVATEGLDTLAGSDFLHLAVRIDGDNIVYEYQVGAAGAINRYQMSRGGHGGGAGIEGGNLLTPWVFAQARAGSASRVVTVHALGVGGWLV